MLALGITLFVFVAMEGITWLTHRYIMHGLLWRWHKDHHNPTAHILEKNDYFFVVFATITIILFLIGKYSESYFYTTWIALGILLYGLAYFLVHDVFIHQRLPWFKRSNNVYFKALRKAHKIHHKHLTPNPGECYGMLWVPFKYFKEAYKSK